jgi:hypothetical protein
MQYVLGNMLNGGGGLNADGLALDLQFAADKTLAARRGPTPVFTRASSATYFGPNVINVQYTYAGDTYNVNLSQDAIVNGRWQWRDGDTEVYFGISNWLLTHDSNLVATSASTTSWRPDDADWTGTNATVTTGNTFGIVRAATNESRFDHDPVTLASRGLLIEESRTNLTVRSDDFGASEWNASSQRNLTVTANDTTSPSGATDADRLTVGATTTVYQVIQNLPASGNLTSGTAYTVSCFFKPNQVTRVSIWAGNAVTLPADAMFDLTGSGSVVANAFGTASIQQYPNGWYRCIITGTAGATSSTTLRISPVSGTSRTYAGNSVDSFWAWGAQLEAGSFPTSYIPTTTGSVVRSADVCSITGANFTSFYNSTSGTLLSEASISNLISSNRGIVQIDNGTNGSVLRHVYSFAEGGFTSIIRAGADTPTVLSIILGTASTIQKRIIAYEGTSFASVTNGGAVATATRTMPTGLNAMKIGNLAESPFYLSGHIAAIRFYKKRLPNAKIQALTV